MMQFDLLMAHFQKITHFIQWFLGVKIKVYKMLFDFIQIENQLYKMLFDLIQIENSLYNMLFDLIHFDKMGVKDGFSCYYSTSKV